MGLRLQYAGAALISAALCGQAVSAQSLRDWHGEARSDVRASAAITIPLGAPRGSDASQPRVDFAFETQRLGTPDDVVPLRFDPQYERQAITRAELSFTLEDNPRLLMNGERVATFGPRLTADDDGERGGGNNTALYVVGGILALGIGATVLVTTEIRDEFSDAIGPED